MKPDPLAETARKIRFGSFELDRQNGELHKAGVRVRLQAQPFRVLAVLVEHAGEVVSREELQRHVWGSETTVDFDHGLDIAVNKIREVLGDNADSPEFIETLAKRGYRFIAPVADSEALTGTAAAFSVSTAQSASLSTVPDPQSQTRWKLAWLLAGAVAGVLAAASWLSIFSSSRSYAPALIQEVTHSGRVFPGFPLQESFAQMATDGSRLYFPQIESGRPVLSQALLGDGETSFLSITTPILAPVLDDISPDGSKLLVRNQLNREAEGALWIVPTLGGQTQQFSNVLAHDATWMPDGEHILYASGTDLMIASANGSDRRKFASLPSRAFWLRWSPDGRLLRFTLLNALNHVTALWEIAADGTHLHPLFPGWDPSASECCGSWTRDGRYYVFQSARSGQNNIWAIEQGGLLAGLLKPRPFALTGGPLSYQSPLASPRGHQIFFLGLNTRSELLNYDPALKLFVPAGNLPNSAQFVRFSRDGRWVAWISLHGSVLWRSRADGTQRLELTPPRLEVYMMEWSPDGQHLVLMAREPGKLWRLYLVDADGANLHPLLNEQRNEADPSWSPDGASVVFGRPPDLMAERSQTKEIYLLNLSSGTFTPIPGSAGLFSPRCSPDGRYIAALPLGQRNLRLFDRVTGAWKTLEPQAAADPVWSSDGHWVYFHNFLEQSQAIYRASVPDGRVERIGGLDNLRSMDIADFRFVGLDPNNLPFIRARVSTANIYTVELDALRSVRRP